MRNIIDSRLFNMILLLTIMGEFCLPWVLKQYYNGYNSKIMVMSVLGSPQSPVRHIYNVWLLWLGSFLTYTAVVYFFATREEFPVISILLLMSIGFFAIGAGVVSGVFSVNEDKNIVTASSMIHGIGAAIGFMALLFFPLLNGVLQFKQKDVFFGVLSMVSFILALAFFVCFIMGDKEQFHNTVLKYEGLWERISLFCMYIPFVYKALRTLFLDNAH